MQVPSTNLTSYSVPPAWTSSLSPGPAGVYNAKAGFVGACSEPSSHRSGIWCVRSTSHPRKVACRAAHRTSMTSQLQAHTFSPVVTRQTAAAKGVKRPVAVTAGRAPRPPPLRYLVRPPSGRTRGTPPNPCSARTPQDSGPRVPAHDVPLRVKPFSTLVWCRPGEGAARATARRRPCPETKTTGHCSRGMACSAEIQ